ncbi:hypothetical protein SARC_08201 [Sphaeroforma arctica JP610]|uniref:Uncharacterized protein n=1 Tax=Sphaeroforma arctica JP610 TaxID=667725 RepID=A0A0L0FS25_9EUKA|nr:hypothetical protein SARC_08201 [Sphaeroforma arctica JP610]KNC79401.1 hypothetical protein SARC_08201 [Sphaeroforma arctica JP610]|eukprot:XP_014153303.1 hypothetical protein SARC_08201 [Sphaeroforma arctica JP610]
MKMRGTGARLSATLVVKCQRVLRFFGNGDILLMNHRFQTTLLRASALPGTSTLSINIPSNATGLPIEVPPTDVQPTGRMKGKRRSPEKVQGDREER